MLGDGCDRLDLSYPATPGVKFCLIATTSSAVECEVVDERGDVPAYDEYVGRVKALFEPLAAGYPGSERSRPRLDIPSRPDQWDLATIACSHVDYYESKFAQAARNLSTRMRQRSLESYEANATAAAAGVSRGRVLAVA
jgi:hypothetical protein